MNRSVVRRLRPDRTTLSWLAPLVLLQALTAAIYAARPSITVTNPVYLAVPFVWIDLGVWAVVANRPPDASRRAAVFGAAVGVGYFLLLAWVGGVVSFGPTDVSGMRTGLYVTTRLPPGWAPVLQYAGGGVLVTGYLYKLVGYAALAYLVALTVVEASGAALSGALGLLSCVSCVWPVAGTVVAAVFGSGSALAAVATNQPYELSTLVFVSAVILLTWRPDAGSLGRLRRRLGA